MNRPQKMKKVIGTGRKPVPCCYLNTSAPQQGPLTLLAAKPVFSAPFPQPFSEMVLSQQPRALSPIINWN